MIRLALPPEEMGAWLALQRRLAAGVHRCEGLALADLARRLDGPPYALTHGVAIITVSGPLMARFGWLGTGLATGYDGLRYQLGEAFRDPAARGVALAIDSPGGEVDGLFDLVDWLAEAKVAAGKPVVGIVDGAATSAAYALAAAANSIAVSRTARIGSIGVWTGHVDESQALAKEGIVITLIQSGAQKTDGHPFGPLPAAVAARWQAEVDDIRVLFAATVARLRGISEAAVLATEAAVFAGPARLKEALALGLVDAVMMPDRAFQVFAHVIGGA